MGPNCTVNDCVPSPESVCDTSPSGAAASSAVPPLLLVPPLLAPPLLPLPLLLLAEPELLAPPLLAPPLLLPFPPPFGELEELHAATITAQPSAIQ
jgi:hypothetical protein